MKVLVLNGSLKHAPDETNTGELAQLVLDGMAGPDVQTEMVRLADYTIPAGVVRDAGDGDVWPWLADKIKACDVLILATSIWWGGRSSLLQRVIERMDYIDEEHRAGKPNQLYNKVGGIVVTGHEDGAMSIIGKLMMVMTFMGLTMPPGCATYWVGEPGGGTAGDPEKRRKNETTQTMAKTLGRNLLFYATLLKVHPLAPGN